MNAYERLMAEAVPTGSFGRARPPKRQCTEPAPRWTPAEQAAHRATLDAALDGFELVDDYASNKRDRYREQRTHLRLVAPAPTPPPDTCTCAKCGGNPASRVEHRPQEGTAA
jgi:hypothetical protein